MRGESEAKVGVLVVGAIVILGAALYMVFGFGKLRGRYAVDVIFDKASVVPGDVVRLAGVPVGQVARTDVTPDNRAKVTVLLDRKKVRLYAGDKFVLSTPTPLGERFLDIVPAPTGRGRGKPVSPGATLRGEAEPSLEDLARTADRLARQLGKVASAAQGVLEGPGLPEALSTAVTTMRSLSAQIATMAAEAGKLASDVRPRLLALAATWERVGRNLTQASAALAQPSLREDVAEISESLRSATARIDDSVAQMQSFLRDPEVQASLKGATKNIEEASTHVKKAAENIESASEDVRHMTGRVKGKVEKLTTGGMPRLSAMADFEYLPKADRSWTEMNIGIEGRSGQLRLGAADIGENTTLNLQLGVPLSGATLRGGIIQSDVGLGYDRMLGNRLGLSVDLRDPNDLKANTLLSYRPPGKLSDYELLVGRRDIGADPFTALGVRLRR
jgi:ABC-type transporter Mla subunit MlaD